MSPSPAINPEALAPGTECCLAILELLHRHPDGLTQSEIARELAISKNMVFRVLGDLATREFVLRDGERRYLLGRKLLTLAVPQVGQRNLIDEAAPEVRALRDACGEGVGLLVPCAGEAVLVYFQPSPHPIRIHYDIGVRIPLHANAPGKVLLAFAEPAERRARLAQQDLRRFTATTITDPVMLEQDLERSRQQGYATDVAEEIDGAHCVAAPVYAEEGRLVAALVITATADRIPVSAFPRVGALAVDAAARISARLRR